ncbi:MAG: hypothetical protein VX800_02110 [Chloroflexota bacterium]|nr:hypothetical protein [Chloroflexota bacterium]
MSIIAMSILNLYHCSRVGEQSNGSRAKEVSARLGCWGIGEFGAISSGVGDA